MTFLYIVLGIIAVFVVWFLYKFFNTTSFYKMVINEYILYRKTGCSRSLSNKIVISKIITNDGGFSISPQAKEIIGKFDVIDSVQFLIWFNSSLSLKLDLIPKMSSSDLKSNIRQKILPIAFNKEQLEYLNSIPDLRNNTIDLYDDFQELGSLLINDFYLSYRA
jgi:hypothetical protein